MILHAREGVCLHARAGIGCARAHAWHACRRCCARACTFVRTRATDTARACNIQRDARATRACNTGARAVVSAGISYVCNPMREVRSWQTRVQPPNTYIFINIACFNFPPNHRGKSHLSATNHQFTIAPHHRHFLSQDLRPFLPDMFYGIN